MLSVTFSGGPLTLGGEQLKVGDKLPAVTLAQTDLAPCNTADTSGLRVFLTVPSVDTPVCDLEVRTFNGKAAELPGVSLYAVSADLPFALARWFGDAEIENVVALSDYRDYAFGHATGTFIDELALLTRAVFIVDASDTIVYAEFVPEITNGPDYETIFKELAAMI